jgi:hypothetical protein
MGKVPWHSLLKNNSKRFGEIPMTKVQQEEVQAILRQQFSELKNLCSVLATKELPIREQEVLNIIREMAHINNRVIHIGNELTRVIQGGAILDTMNHFQVDRNYEPTKQQLTNLLNRGTRLARYDNSDSD